MNFNTVYNAMRKQAMTLGGSGRPLQPGAPAGKPIVPNVPPAAQPQQPPQQKPDPTQMNPLTAMWQAFSQMANNYKQALNATTTAMKGNNPQQPGAAQGGAPVPQPKPGMPV